MDRLFPAAIVSLTIVLWGCSGGSTPPNEPTATKVRLAPARFTQPLTDEDIEAFLAIVRQLPGHKPPAFRPVTPPQFVDKLSGKELAALWQRTFQAAYHPSTQVKFWQRDTLLMETIEDAGVDPDALAAVLVRLSSAVSRRAIDESIDLSHVRRKADFEVARLVRQVDDAAERNAELRANLVHLQRWFAV